MPRWPFDDLCQLLSIVVLPDVDDDRYAAFAEWTPEDWEDAIALASSHLVLPSIAARLSKDRACETIDPELHAFFEGIHAGNARQNDDFLGQMDRFCTLANSLGIRPILLKGMAYLAEDTYGDPGMRFMSDIDVLVDKNERDEILAAMKGHGYAKLAEDRHETSFWDEHHHAPPMLDPDGNFVIEVHSDTLKEGGGALGLDVQGISSRALDRRRGDVYFSVPCIEDRVAHCIAHNQLGHNDRFVGSIEMRDVLDLHFLTIRGPCSDEQWTHVLQRFDRAGHGDMARGFLNALKAMVPDAALGPCPAGGRGVRQQKNHYLRRYGRSRFIDPTLYSDLMAREWHRFLALKTYRRQLWTHLSDISYWRLRWRNLLGIIRRT